MPASGVRKCTRAHAPACCAMCERALRSTCARAHGFAFVSLGAFYLPRESQAAARLLCPTATWQPQKKSYERLKAAAEH
eukprot:4173743-Pleurochrysis_carterae.AAC.1